VLAEEFLRLAQRDLTKHELALAAACVTGSDVWGEGFDPEAVPTLTLALASLTIRPLVVLSAEAELLRARQIRFGARANCFSLDHEQSNERRAATLAALAAFANGTATSGAVIWCTLEALREPAVRAALASSRPLSLVVEGAHAASPKAHELRPSLALLPALRDACGSTSLVAFTRGVPAAVREDAVLRLGLRATEDGHRIVRAPLIGEGTRLCAVTGERRKTDLAALVQRLPRPTAIFCATPHEADAVYSELSSAQVPVHRYHGGMPVSDRATEMLHFTLPGRRAVMVATSAFQPGSGLAGIDAGPAATPEGLGLGFGRQRLRSLVHLCTPASLEQYAQELALLGSSEGPTEAVLYFAPESIRKCEESVAKLRVSDTEVDAVANSIAAADSLSLSALEQSASIGRKATRRVLDLMVDAGLAQVDDSGTVTPRVSKGDLEQTLALLTADLELLRSLDADRLNAVVAYVMQDGCRTRALESGLGGTVGEEACGVCDRCMPEVSKADRSDKSKDSMLVVRRRPAAQIWSVGAPTRDQDDLDDDDEDEDDEEDSGVVVRGVFRNTAATRGK
jgi:superfamily II DNA helicase RecQ